MKDEAPLRNLSPAEWESLVSWVTSTGDPLEDGAIAQLEPDFGVTMSIVFYASSLNKPRGWRYPFLSMLPNQMRPVELVGRAWRDGTVDLVRLEVENSAAAQAIRADYESGVADMDYVAYEQAVEMVITGKPADAEWLDEEYRRLLHLFRSRPK